MVLVLKGLIMKVNRSIGYALLAIGYLVQHKDEEFVLSQKIAKAYYIPLEFLLKIMKQLVKANILSSKRGPHGGFCLARPSEDITMIEVIEAIEGPMAVSLGLGEQAPKDRFGAKADQVYNKVNTQARDSFKKVKLSDLI
jgi:Rrf2 family protein